MKNRKALFLAVLSAFLFVRILSAEEGEKNMDNARLEAFVNANIKAVHAYQAMAAKKLGKKLSKEYWNYNEVPETELKKLVELQKEMLSEPLPGILSWLKGEKSDFNADKYLKPISEPKLSLSHPRLPFNAWFFWLKDKAPRAKETELDALANLQQVLAEINRDGDILQDLFRVYSAAGLPVYLGK